MGKNIGAYFGERIAVRGMLEEIVVLARQHGWLIEELLPARLLPLLALRRIVPGATRRIYLSSGIHGDEPAGPLAVRRLLA